MSMRSTIDRIRQAVLFEVLALMVVTPLGALIFDLKAADMGVLAVGSALVATGWNYVFNLGFDRLLLRRRGTAAKTLPLRIAHALAFEAGLLVILLPPTAWWLEIGLGRALALDAGLAGFYVVYAFVFTWAYDRLLPPPPAAPEAKAAPEAEAARG